MFTHELAKPTDQMLLTDILDLDRGETVDPQAFLSRELALVIRDRNELAGRYARNAEVPWLVCRICGAAVMLVRTQQRCFYFRHHPDEEGKRDCPISTRGVFSANQINCMKYNAAKESLAHLRLKGIIRDSLIADDQCSEPLVERVWRGMPLAERATWRKPDVQVAHAGQRLAFEVQLSTTFLTEIVGRREFYRENGGAIIWVFQSFDPTQTRTSEEDIYYLNNRNVFIVNEASLERSREARRMALDCWHAIPHLRGRTVIDEWVRKEVFLDQLTVKTDHQLVYFYDYEARRTELEESLDLNILRKAFYDFWLEHGATDTLEADVAWQELRSRMSIAVPGAHLPTSFNSGRFHGAVSIVLSARYGRPVGYRLQSLINVTNTAFDYYKAYLLPFGWTLKSFKQDDLLAEQDTKGTWAKRRRIIRESLQNKDEAYRQDLQYSRLFAFLIPEIKDELAEARQW
ncbi:DUF6035 family protein [Pseudomonas oryzae]|uniref:Competence protein CoiA-like family protein n=1 Tax=Pseudomonas oryzae TaxID=1392877 RepID=A0A1H1TIB1_9PSED|nr:DUF6035 family protein [Pseudomonas oryzae]SDS59942.1 hypothetical protein SAMN05216221_2173 [Pseudomonas oryzae]